MSTYHSFRVFLIETDQYELFPDSEFEFSKEGRFKSIFQKIREEEKLDFYYRKSRYLIYYLDEFAPNILLLELAREKITTKPQEGDKRIEDVEDTEFPYIYLVVDIEKQILLIEHRSTVFSDIESPKNILEEFISKEIDNDSILVKIRDISSSSGFWKTVNNAKGIYQFKLTLNGPNLFEGRFHASELVQNLKDEYNSTETIFNFKNVAGKLKLLKKNLEEYIRMVSSGGGGYFLKYLNQDGKSDTMTDKSNTIKKRYDDVENMDPENIKNDLDEIDRANEE